MNRPKRATPRKADSAASRALSADSPVPTWSEAVAGKPDQAFYAYTPTVSFSRGSLVSHAKFGKGIVVELEPSKATILFEEGLKKLVHGQQP